MIINAILIISLVGIPAMICSNTEITAQHHF